MIQGMGPVFPKRRFWLNNDFSGIFALNSLFFIKKHQIFVFKIWLVSLYFRVLQGFPFKHYIGIADGSKINWDFLEKRTEHHILDFYHATEYLSSASYAFSETATERFKWFSQACHKLKHDENGALELKLEMEARATEIETDKEIGGLIKKQLKSAIVYFNNQLSRMKYSEYVAQNFPIGSGVVEAACKTLIKQRLCRSGMRWKHQGAGIVISLRALVQTTGRWTQFWNKINQASISDLIIA